jgi:hypothetical protein
MTIFSSTLILASIFKYLFFPQKNSPQKPQTRVKRTREEIWVALEKRKKVITKSPRSVLKRKNIFEKNGTLGSVTHP